MISLPAAIAQSAEPAVKGPRGRRFRLAAAASPPHPHLTYGNRPKRAGAAAGGPPQPPRRPQPPPTLEPGPGPGGREAERGGRGEMHVEPEGGK